MFLLIVKPNQCFQFESRWQNLEEHCGNILKKYLLFFIETSMHFTEWREATFFYLYEENRKDFIS